MSIYHLEHRAVLHLCGEDPIGFLQDILTADIRALGAGQMRQSCLLSPQGRILIEMTILIENAEENAQSLYLACDHRQIDELMKKLKLYRLRRKITITKQDDSALIALADGATAPATALMTFVNEASYFDLCLAPKEALSAISCQPLSAYHNKRIAHAMPEGPDDLIPNRALMLEAGLDKFDAVDFKKGCYIGQEVTARTRYRGLVKRRLVPLTAARLTTGEAIEKDGKEIGVVLSVAPHDDAMIGLASLRLDAIEAAQAGEPLICAGEVVSLSVPPHILPIP